MSIDNFGILSGYVLWLLILLGMGCFLMVRHSLAFRIFQRGEWIRQVFAPAEGERAHFPERAVHRCGRSDRLLELMSACYSRNYEAYSSRERIQLSQALTRILLERIPGSSRTSALSRCLILRCLALTGIRSPQIDLFIDSCAEGSPLEQMWVHTIRSAAPPSERAQRNADRRTAACN